MLEKGFPHLIQLLKRQIDVSFFVGVQPHLHMLQGECATLVLAVRGPHGDQMHLRLRGAAYTTISVLRWGRGSNNKLDLLAPFMERFVEGAPSTKKAAALHPP